MRGSWGIGRARTTVIALAALALTVGADIATAAAGDGDPSFGHSGLVTTDFNSGSLDEAHAVAIDGRGRIVVAGTTLSSGGAKRSGDQDFAVARYRPNGRLDASFGSGGLVTTDLQGGLDDEAGGVAIDSRGRIVVGGTSGCEFAVVRYTSDGTLDGRFGNGGVVASPCEGSLETFGKAIAVDGANRIIIAGDDYVSATGGVGFSLGRYMPDGTPDATFGHNGFVLPRHGTMFGNALAIDPANGSILVAGQRLSPDASHYSFAALRYDANGNVVNGFAPGPTGNADANAVAVDPATGRVVLAGWDYKQSLGDSRFALAGYLGGGSADPSLNGGAPVLFRAKSGLNRLNALAIDPQSRIVVAGESPDGFTVARLTPAGALDGSFGAGGIVVAKRWPGLGAPQTSVAYGLTVDGSGNPVAVGSARSNSNPETADFAVGRWLSG